MAYTGKYKVVNRSKYKGNPDNVVYRSQWEFLVFRLMDNSPGVEWWVSEECVIPYVSLLDGRPHRYFIDILFKSTSGEITAVEIKPKKQTQRPTKPERMTKRYYEEVRTYATNVSKWNAAKAYCESKGWKFKVWHEDVLRGMGLKI